MVFFKPYLFFELINSPVKLLASMCLEQFDQSCVTEFPCFYLLFVVNKAWNRLMHLVIQCIVANLFTALSVSHIMESRMVTFLDAITFWKNALTNEVEVINPRWEPWNCFATQRDQSIFYRQLSDSLHGLLNISVFDIPKEVNKEWHCTLALHYLWWSRLDASHVDIMFLENI